MEQAPRTSAGPWQELSLIDVSRLCSLPLFQLAKLWVCLLSAPSSSDRSATQEGAKSMREKKKRKENLEWRKRRSRLLNTASRGRRVHARLDTACRHALSVCLSPRLVEQRAPRSRCHEGCVCSRFAYSRFLRDFENKMNKLIKPYKRLQSQGQGHVKNGLQL